ncbi:MAG: class I SAM-dependent methyltransferase [Bacteriodetes bacterium]|nr:class I SAM-dependent methyltransferase [Bacteroidota bacterium]
MMWSAVEFSHRFVREFAVQARVAFDATVGNGGDTAFLLSVVAEDGIVFGTDVQQTALDNAEQLLQQTPFTNYRLFNRSCTEVLACMQELGVETLDIVMMNCGYLPGGDKSVTTNANDTVLTIECCCNVLAVSGVLSVVVYPGHEAGASEVQAVEQFVRQLSPKQFQVCTYGAVNMMRSPQCYMVQRLR